MNAALFPAANAAVHVREKASKIQPLVNAERRLLFLFAVIRRFNETVASLAQYRKILGDQDLQNQKERDKANNINFMNRAAQRQPTAKPRNEADVLVDELLTNLDSKNDQNDGNNNNNHKNRPYHDSDREEEADLQRRKWIFDEFDVTHGNRIKEIIFDSRNVVGEIGFAKHAAYLDNDGWWLSIPTNNASTNFRTGARYRCRVGDSTFYSLIHCWATLLGVRFADAGSIAENQHKTGSAVSTTGTDAAASACPNAGVLLSMLAVLVAMLPVSASTVVNNAVCASSSVFKSLRAVV